MGYGANPMQQSILEIIPRDFEVHESNNNDLAVHSGSTKARLGWFAQPSFPPQCSGNKRAEITGKDLPMGYGTNPMQQSIFDILTRDFEVHE